MTNVILSSMYEIGDKIGHFSAYALVVIGIVLLVWIMFRYLDTSDLK